MRVERYGFNEQGYLTRLVLIGLCATAARSSKRVSAAFLGCGALWTVAEATLTLTGLREGAITLKEAGTIAALGAALVRGFSEGAAVVVMSWWEFKQRKPLVLAALSVLLFDAALHDPFAPLLSGRSVVAPIGLSVTFAFSLLYVWRVAQRSNQLPVAIVWRMIAIGWGWNAFAILSGSRRVIPRSYTMAFTLYDTVFEIALLYAGLVETVFMLPIRFDESL